MAFHQPKAREATNRMSAHAAWQDINTRVGEPSTTPQATSPAALAESQTWVLFSPNDDATTTTSYLSSLQTPGRSRASELGSASLNTIARSDVNSAPQNSAIPSVLSADDDELDVLDSHLPEFRTAPQQQSAITHSIPVLPTHDGLGLFKLATTGLEAEMQEQIYAFEQYNPRRLMTQRRETDLHDLMQLDKTELDAAEVERNSRIEAWQQEQSQLFLEAVRKETRRRKPSTASPTVSQRRQSTASASAAVENNAQGGEWHEQDALAYGSEEEEGMWTKLTRRVLRDIMGIDERVLALLLGESTSGTDILGDQSPKLTASEARGEESAAGGSGPDMELRSLATWSPNFMDRIARELGHLVHRLSTHHPGAFSTYARMQQMAIPYAGLPVIPEAEVASAQESSYVQKLGAKGDGAESRIDGSGSMPSVLMPKFEPTISQRQPPGVASVTGSRRLSDDAANPRGSEQSSTTFTQKEWEQDLDVRLVFRYLRSRFTSGTPQTQSWPSTQTSRIASQHTTPAQEAAARAARVRLHHPLVGRNLNRRATINHSHGGTANSAAPTAATAASPIMQHIRQRPAGSCGSQSTTARSARRSGTRRSASFSTSAASRPSSRHYWDIGRGSVTSGSLIASTGPMGSWGEV